ncbi:MULTISPECIES: TIGR03085 family metal-binding protein [Arthrobacter]|uniref:TIGR03085 family metal-binding protein n=2 Tax=Arthrobacter TaxID=1663 RepID=A0ABU9KG95_9MICC|nr:TIGR03085 family metal-binding protein [Arthrobacter sp. YJM1]MDP5225908.1 TIGR03085 family metal-binding protein [Arthrobacter sp. YJM1]
MRFVAPSRDFLAETLLAAGPDAPTLCEGWDTRHLLAHLHLRETSPRRALGLAVKAFAPATGRAVSELAATLDGDAYRSLVEEFRAGPGRLSPWRVPQLAELGNLAEFFVHAEDIRRAGDRWAPRTLDADYAEALWTDLIRRAALLYRGVDLGIVLVRPNGPRHVARRAPDSVAILGDPGELMMHAYGRASHALVSFEGRPDAIALLRSAALGV